MSETTDPKEQRLLLHVCCGPCATHAILALRKDYAVTLFFSNSNIAPRNEYDKRLENAVRLAEQCGVPLVCDAYDHAAWLAHVAGLEREPERGRRCERCFAFNLARTAQSARQHGFDCFTTTLTVSPHKDTATVFRVGRSLGRFLEVNLKKGDGFKRSIELSAAYGLYRQAYCGCEFSLAAARERTHRN